MLRRSAALAAVVAACALVLALLVRGPAYELTLTVDSASQLVKGDQVKVGGVPVGKVSGIGPKGIGLYRCRDKDGDDQYESVEFLKKFDGAGEHGPHAIVLGPDDGGYDAARAVRAVPGVDEVEVTLVWDPPWTMHRMSEATRLQLGLL